MNEAEPKVTLNQLVFRIILIGVIALLAVSVILLQEEKRQSLRQWQSDTISHSAAVTASYYSILVTKLILGQTAEVENVLQQTHKSEGLQSAKILSPSELTTAVLETCNIDYAKAFFQQAPTCFEATTGVLRIYHELRSAGHSLGYLMKEVALPSYPVFGTAAFVPHMAMVVFCFLGVNMIVLFYFRRNVMQPTKRMIASLNQHQSLRVVPQDYRCHELYTLAVSLSSALEKIVEYQERTKRLELDARIGQVTSQVAHDIRSPLAALNVVVTLLAELPEEKRVLVRRATQRIQDIANSLIAQSQPARNVETTEEIAEESGSVELLSSLIDPLISEKRFQFRARREVEIQAELCGESYGLFGWVQPTQFKRVLSNLVNNAVEGIAGQGTVQVRLRPWEGQIGVEVQDTGTGIPPEILAKLTERGATFGKAGGSGLGLFHARERVEAWGGTLTIASTAGKGTTVTLRLPAAAAPPWFVPVLTLRDGMTIAVLDDDQSIHDIWDGRLAPLRAQLPQLTVHHFTTADDTRAWHAQHVGKQPDCLYLVDYELIGQPANGLALIEQLQIPQQAILVTSRYEEPAIRDRCAALGVRLIPKGLAGFVPIVVEAKPLVSSPSPRPPLPMASAGRPLPRGEREKKEGDRSQGYRVLLIDDDLLIAGTWAAMRKPLQIGELVHVANLEELQAQQIDPAAFDVAFVDKNLDGSAHDGAATIAWLRAHGARRIVLASGERADKLRADPQWAAVDAICEEKLPASLAGFVS